MIQYHWQQKKSKINLDKAIQKELSFYQGKESDRLFKIWLQIRENKRKDIKA